MRANLIYSLVDTKAQLLARKRTPMPQAVCERLYPAFNTWCQKPVARDNARFTGLPSSLPSLPSLSLPFCLTRHSSSRKALVSRKAVILNGLLDEQRTSKRCIRWCRRTEQWASGRRCGGRSDQPESQPWPGGALVGRGAGHFGARINRVRFASSFS